MIEGERHKTALAALHQVLFRARNMARVGSPASDLEVVLDWAEVLPTYIASPFDQTKEFRLALEAIAERFPDFETAVRVFDNTEAIAAIDRRRAAAAAALVPAAH